MKKTSAFTLLELLAVITIISVLTAMVIPHIGRIQDRAQSVVCINNLRQIGVGVLGYVGDNNNEYPVIEPDPSSPVYQPASGDDPTEVEAKPMIDVLGPYGVTDAVLRCPADLKGANWYAKNDPHTSYQWRVFLDSENASAPKIYGGRRGYGVRIVKPSRVTICTDYEGVHSGRLNRLYADGHVSKPN